MIWCSSYTHRYPPGIMDDGTSKICFCGKQTATLRDGTIVIDWDGGKGRIPLQPDVW